MDRKRTNQDPLCRSIKRIYRRVANTLNGIEYVEKSKKSEFEQTKQPHPYLVGENYFIRTVTMFHTGKLVGVFDNELLLENAAWIADTDRFTQALETCEFSEVELFPQDKQVIVNRQSVIDAVIINKLPKEQK